MAQTAEHRPESTRLTRRAGVQASVGGVLLAVSLAAELIHPVQTSDGRTTEPVLHTLYLAAWLAGWLLVAMATLGLRAILRRRGATSRAGTVGTWLSVAGAACFALNAIGGLAGVFTGTYYEGAFVLVLVAFPLLIAGNLTLAWAARGSYVPRGTWILLGIGAIGLTVALLAEVDPFHDLGFLAFFGTWIILGISLWSAGRVDANLRSTK
jgi:hypothetical protein